jgi:hypothetical protein
MLRGDRIVAEFKIFDLHAYRVCVISFLPRNYYILAVNSRSRQPFRREFNEFSHFCSQERDPSLGKQVKW